MESPNRTSPLLNRGWRSYFTGKNFKLKTSIWSELGGSVGDLGTYIPIVLALSLVNHLDLGTTLIFTAFYNIITGFLYGIPMPVQPMKSIAAVAISESQTHLTIPQIMAAGISTSSVLLILGVTGLMSFFYRFIPLPVVRGVQLSQGLAFAFSAIKYIRNNQNFVTGKSGSARSWVGLDAMVLYMQTCDYGGMRITNPFSLTGFAISPFRRNPISVHIGVALVSFTKSRLVNEKPDSVLW